MDLNLAMTCYDDIRSFIDLFLLSGMLMLIGSICYDEKFILLLDF